MFATGETVGLAEWIIDDTCLVIISLIRKNANFAETKEFQFWMTIFPLSPSTTTKEFRVNDPLTFERENNSSKKL